MTTIKILNLTNKAYKVNNDLKRGGKFQDGSASYMGGESKRMRKMWHRTV
jgi:hypothetical protein